MNLKIPLDQGLCAVFTDARSGERTPTGAVRRGLRPSPHRSRGEAETEHGQCSRPPRTGLSDSLGSPRATTSRRTPRETGADVGSDRACGHLRVARRRRPAGAFDGTGQLEPKSGAARRPSTLATLGWEATCCLRAAGGASLSGDVRATESWLRSRRNWGHPNWTQRGRFRLAPGPMARATGSA